MRNHLLELSIAIGLAGWLCSAPAGAAPLERHPYLQSTTDTETTVVWTTTVDSSGAVEYGSAPGMLDQTAQSTVMDTQHEVRITGLQPDTRYYYRVISDGQPAAGGDEDHYFVTAPSVGTPRKFRAWIVGDSGTGGSMQGAVRDAMVAHVGGSRPDIYLHMGDMAYSDGTYDEFTDRFYAMYADILRNMTVWPTMGNHEGHTSDSDTQSGPYYDGYVLPVGGEAGGLPSGTEAYYSFDYGNAHFIVLDSHDSPREPDGAMLTWAADDLAATDAEWVIAYWHHPPYTKGSHDSDNEGQLIDMRENALPILEAGGVDLVLGGHSHIYERSFLLDGAYQTPSVAGMGVLDGADGKTLSDGPYTKPPGLAAHQGAVYVVAGHGGTGVSQDAVHPLMYFTEVANGSCLLDIQQNRLSLINVRWDGEVTDRVAMIKGDGIVIGQPDGGETLGAGMTYAVRWATVGDIPNVKLEYSVTDGNDWTVIEESIANTGTYVWTVPGVDTTQGLVRVSAADDPSVFDESNAVFDMSSQAEVEPVSFGDDWRYHDQGVDQGDAWLTLDFDDSGWPEGPGQLGYGDGDEATQLVDADPNYPSAYFRKTFTLDAEPIEATVTVLHDDGAAVWINGQLVHSVNVDATGYADWASAASDDNALSEAQIDASALVEGDNVIAVMAKQANETSSDLSFDLQLRVTVMYDPPPPGDDGGSTGTGSGTSATAGDSAGTVGDGLSTGGLDSTDGTAGATGDAAGCGCRSRSTPASTWMLLVGLFALRRRRSS